MKLLMEYRKAAIVRKAVHGIAVLILFSHSSFSQTRALDSLKKVLATQGQDTSRANTLYLIANRLRNNAPAEAIKYAQEGLDLSSRLNFVKGKGKTLLVLGIANTNMGNNKEAISFFDKSVEAFAKIKDTSLLARALSNKANVFINTGDFNEALSIHNEALRLRKLIHDTSGIGVSYGNIGNIYTNLGNFSDALQSYFGAMKILEKAGDKKGVSDCVANISTIYRRQQNYTDALKYSAKGLRLSEECGDKQGITNGYINMGVVYNLTGKYNEALNNFFLAKQYAEQLGSKAALSAINHNIADVYKHRKNYREAIEFYNKALEIRLQINDTRGIAFSYNNIAQCYFFLDELGKAESFFIKGIDLARSIGSKEEIAFGLENFFQLEAKQGKFKEALENYKLFIRYRDSLSNEETTRKTVETQMQYEFDKKESETKAAQEKKDIKTAEDRQKQRLVLWFTVSGLLVVLALSGIILRSLILNKRKNKIISEQKEIVERQKEQVEEKQKEILDSIRYAKRIQTALMTSEKYIERKLNEINKK